MQKFHSKKLEEYFQNFGNNLSVGIYTYLKKLNLSSVYAKSIR